MLDTELKGSGVKPSLHPVDYAVITQGLLAAAREMGAKLIRSAYSTIVREARDASAALHDRYGNVVAQAELIPMQLGPMTDTLRACMERYPVDKLVPGDFYVNNDPFSGGQHLQDVFIYTPIFFEGQIVGFAGTVAHHIDLGGGNPGISNDAPDVHAEGIIISPAKFNMEIDWNGGSLERFVSANVRVPTQTIGDFNAQFAANAVGSHRIIELCEKYGEPTVSAVMEELLNYSERRFRAAVRDVPDGVYYGEDAVDDDGLSDTPLVVKAKVTIAGDDISVDYEGTCPQIRRNLNCPFSSTVSAALSAIKSTLTSPDIPFNEGMKRPVKITAPKGSLLNPHYPAPNRARMVPAYRAYNAVMKALAQVVPEQVIAGGHDTTTSVAISRLGEGGYKVYLEIFGGGYGASPVSDGCDAVDSPLSNCANTPIEALDMEFDYFRVEQYGLLEDSSGHGKYHGGLGIVRRYKILKDNVSFANYTDRMRLSPYGLFGGQDGSRSRTVLERNGQEIEFGSKVMHELQTGDILTIYTCGGGGYGDPAERPQELLKHDVEQGYFSSEDAEKFYGRIV